MLYSLTNQISTYAFQQFLLTVDSNLFPRHGDKISATIFQFDITTLCICDVLYTSFMASVH